ncbi:response regulator [Tepidicella xavieri]|jgi:CitB family two-component system response regulator CitT|uniref:Transcriptional regulatory protein n=1 Tax=Tepidicella xavieri TaxID=360241 RepID=A0A4R6U7M9_9BURK|nr:response regulator [Tepidicella xavieri]TDQ40575.1 CitB family two-component system response regulator CitT [Tepidicella xavieri]
MKGENRHQSRRYRVLIVEDDFRIARINQAMVEQHAAFEVVGSCRDGRQALAWLQQHPHDADLALFDVYLPDVEGLSLLWEARRICRHLDIVMVTAAKEVDTVEEALRAGVFDFLIKPVQAVRMQAMLDRYVQRRNMGRLRREISQEQLDEVLTSALPEIRARTLPKGVDPLSLDTFLQALSQANEALTASDLAERTGTSRSTARRYLEYLVGTGQAVVAPAYGEVGRPQRLYQLKPNQ